MGKRGVEFVRPLAVLALAALASGRLAAQAPQTGTPAPVETSLPITAVWNGTDTVLVTNNRIPVPLPDGTVLFARFIYASEANDEHPVLTQRATVKGKEYRLEVKDDQGRLMPGDYRIIVAVDDLGRQSPALAATLRRSSRRRLSGTELLTIGSRSQVCVFLNKRVEDILAVSKTVRNQFPELAKVIELAAKTTGDSEKEKMMKDWEAWQERSPIGMANKKLGSLYLDYGSRRLLPLACIEISKLQSEVSDLYTSVEIYLGPMDFPERDVVAKNPSTDPSAPVPSVDNLHDILFKEGRVVYAESASRVAEEALELARARRGKGAGDWTARAARWSKELDEIQGHFEAYLQLAWLVDSTRRAQKALEVKELFAVVRSCVAACGEAVEGRADDAKLQPLQDAIRKQLPGFRNFTS